MQFLNYLFPRYIQHVLLIATHKCNSKCIMCNIWQENKFDDEMSLGEIKNIFDQEIFSKIKTVSFSGGEAFLREDLIDVIKYFLDTKNDLKSILIATNGLALELILKKTNEILRYIKDKKLNTNVWFQISCDGADETADKVRGTPGAFQKINSLIDSLNELKKSYTNLYTKIIFLTLPVNTESLKKITDYAKQKNIGCQISHLFMSKEYYKNDKNDINLKLTKDQIKKIICFLNNKKDKSIADYYYTTLVRNMYFGEKRKDDCLFLTPRGVFIESNGDVLFCMHSHAYKLGNIKETPDKNFWKGEEYKEKRKLVIQNCCKYCKNSCGFNLMKFPENFLRNLWTSIKNRKSAEQT